MLKLVSPNIIVPNFILIMVICLGFNLVTPGAATLAFSLGLVFDLYSGVLLGPWAGTFVLVYVILSLLSQRLYNSYLGKRID